MPDQPVAPPRLKPLFLIEPGMMKPRDIKRAEKLAGICIVECSKPEQARFLEPPISADIDAQARAALELMRYVLRETSTTTTSFYGAKLIMQFVDLIMYAPKPAPVAKVTQVAKR